MFGLAASSGAASGLTTLDTVIAILAGAVTLVGSGGLLAAGRRLRKSWRREDRLDQAADVTLGTKDEPGVRARLDRQDHKLDDVAKDVSEMKTELSQMAREVREQVEDYQRRNDGIHAELRQSDERLWAAMAGKIDRGRPRGTSS